MRIIFIFLTFISCCFMQAQTPVSILSNSGNLERKAAGVAAYNPWLGAQLVHNFAGTGDFGDNLVITGRILHELNTNDIDFKIPIMGNISSLKSDLLESPEMLGSTISNIVIGDQGLNLGLYPYYVIDDYNDDSFYFVVHGSVGWKLNGFQDDSTETTNYLNTGRFSAGIEIGYGIFDEVTGDRPITLSLTPVLSIFNKEQYGEIFEQPESSIFSFEVTGVVPISKTGIGVLFQQVVSSKIDNVFRVGIVFTGQSE